MQQCLSKAIHTKSEGYFKRYSIKVACGTKLESDANICENFKVSEGTCTKSKREKGAQKGAPLQRTRC